VAKKQKQKKEPTPFGESGLPASVMAANHPVESDREEDGSNPTPSTRTVPPPPTALNMRRVYTREDFLPGKAWVSGFACGKCGCEDLRVFRTERCPESRAVVRTRICRNCGEKVKTVEQ